MYIYTLYSFIYVFILNSITKCFWQRRLEKHLLSHLCIVGWYTAETTTSDVATTEPQVTEAATTEPTTTGPQSCPSGFTLIPEGCFYVETNREEEWTDAEDHCQEFGENVHLARVDTQHVNLSFFLKVFLVLIGVLAKCVP